MGAWSPGVFGSVSAMTLGGWLPGVATLMVTMMLWAGDSAMPLSLAFTMQSSVPTTELLGRAPVPVLPTRLLPSTLKLLQPSTS